MVSLDLDAPPIDPVSAPTTDPTVRRLLGRFWPHRRSLALALVLVAAHSAVPGLLVLLVKVVLDDVLVRRNEAQLWPVAIGVTVLYTLNGLLGFVRGMLTRTVAWDVITTLRSDVFSALLRQEPAFFATRTSGALTSRVLTDVDDLQYGVSAIVTAVQKPLTLLFLVLAALQMSPALTATALVVAPAVVLPVRWLGHRLREHAAVGLDQRAHLAGFTTESFRSIEAIQAAGAESHRLAGFVAHNRRLHDAALRSFAARLLPSPVVETAASLGVAAVIVVGGGQVVAGTLEPGALVAFLLAIGLLNDPLKGLAEVVTLGQRAAAGASAAFALLDRAPAIVGGTQPFPSENGLPLVSFDKVTIDYGAGPIVSMFSMDIEAGEVVALAGPSGVGKTSLARLLPRLHDPYAGTVRVRGADVRDLTLPALRHAVAVVGQTPMLFDETVLWNVRLTCPTASLDDVARALQAADAWTFVTALPEGIHTRLSEGGSPLSGGERQRLCIARAFLQNAPILVLDEPTSALDPASEARVQAALDRLCEGRAVLLVSHRESTLARAHRVVHLERPLAP